MGCGAGKKVIQETRSVQEKNKFQLKIITPDKTVVDFKHDTDYDELPLTTIMNFLLFSHIHAQTFNANFISKYNPKLKRFQYFIQRLVGVPMENEDNPYEGKQWVAYINDSRMEWDQICENELSVKPTDNLKFCFELISN
ncbi:hypothetical protein SteCoe_10002 [Stentor coeruleus]|uniref:Uncharacterized protein n=1 Tax=Stentor coeruleus TaxID=5963 RepID=A0A1R2CGI2_9CILI|nr:hypothetical protein SteCoe_10002 [Stentor coeruleus]